MQKKLRSCLNKLNFFLGNNPEVERCDNWRDYIPNPYKAILLISTDFELAWASRYTASCPDPLGKALKNARIERENVPKILELCNRFDIPITWATVGHLFLEGCTQTDGKTHPELPRLPHFENSFWRFSGSDWFEHDPATDYQTNPEWYCPDLIRQIIGSETRHEIGCHTFSHIDCRNSVCSPEIIRSELKLCKELASEYNLVLKSFVHPGHTIGNLPVIREEGFTNFRTDYRNVLGYPKKHSTELWELQQTAELIYRADWSVGYHIHRYKEIIRRAIKTNTVAVIWFHPSVSPVLVEQILPELFRFIDQNRDKIWVTTHSEYLAKLETDNEHR